MRKSFSIRGRASRSELVTIYLVYLACGILLRVLQTDDSPAIRPQDIVAMVAGLALLVHLPALVTTVIRRFHDLDRSGWSILLLLVPILNFILILLLVFKQGTYGQNRFDTAGGHQGERDANQGGRASSGSSRESLRQAAGVLGLPNDLFFSEDEVKTRWRKVMERVHPDAGGTNYFAEQANAAKDTLLTWIKAGHPDPDIHAAAAAAPRAAAAKKGSFAGNAFKTVGGIAVAVVVIALIARGTSAHDQVTWELGTEKEADGKVLHLLSEQIVGDRSDGVRFYIGCFTSGVEPADDIRIFFDATGSSKIESIKYRRASDSDTSEAKHNGNSYYIGALKTVDKMTGDDFTNAFGPAAIIIFGKWLLSNPEDRNLNGDIVTAMRSYYGPALSDTNMLFDIKYAMNGIEKSEVKEVDFAPLARKRSELLKECYLKDPFI